MTALAHNPRHLWAVFDPQDAHARDCCRWLVEQPTWFPLECLPAGSQEAKRILRKAPPEVAKEELVVVNDLGDVYLGPNAWVMTLYPLREYTHWSRRLATSALLPEARSAVGLLCRGGARLARALEPLPDAELLLHLRDGALLGRVRFRAILKWAVGGMSAVVLLLSGTLLWLTREELAVWAADHDHVAILEVLVLARLDLDRAMAAAVRDDRPKAVRLLIQRGANPTGDRWERPLQTALFRGQRETVTALLDGGADVNAVDVAGFNPLRTVAALADPWPLETLIRAGADVDATDEYGTTALMVAAGPNWDRPSRGQVLALAEAADRGEMLDEAKNVRLLLKAGAQPNRRDRAGDTALMRAMNAGRLAAMSAVSALLHGGADPNIHGNMGRTALIVATSNGWGEIMRALIASGADVNAADDEDRTALSYAAGNLSLVNTAVLLEAHADPNLADRPRGWTPILYTCGYTEAQAGAVRSLLVQAGAKGRCR